MNESKRLDNLILNNSENALLRMMSAFRQIGSSNFIINLSLRNFDFLLINKVPAINQIISTVKNENSLTLSNLYAAEYQKHHLIALALSLYSDVNYLFYLFF